MARVNISFELDTSVKQDADLIRVLSQSLAGFSPGVVVHGDSDKAAALSRFREAPTASEPAAPAGEAPTASEPAAPAGEAPTPAKRTKTRAGSGNLETPEEAPKPAAASVPASSKVPPGAIPTEHDIMRAAKEAIEKVGGPAKGGVERIRDFVKSQFDGLEMRDVPVEGRADLLALLNGISAGSITVPEPAAAEKPAEVPSPKQVTDAANAAVDAIVARGDKDLAGARDHILSSVMTAFGTSFRGVAPEKRADLIAFLGKLGAGEAV